MPIPMDPARLSGLNSTASYPALTKQATGQIDGVLTDVMTTFFADKIMVTIIQDGRLAQWIHVPLESLNPNKVDQHLPSATDDDSLLPMAHLTPKTLLGGSNQERETVGQLYATQIASIIANQDPREKRTVLIGIGLSKAEASRETFYDIIDLVKRCL